MPRINLLPWRQQRRQRQQRIFCAQLAASFAAATALAAAFGFHLAAQLDYQQERNRSLTAEVADLDHRRASIDAVRRHKEALESRTDLLAQLWQQRSTTVDIFNQLARTMVGGAHYTELQRRDDAIAAQGMAASNVRVSALMRSLDASHRFATPALQGIAAKAHEDYGDDATLFELTFDVASPEGT